MSSVKSDFKVGDKVSHPKLGEGDVLDIYPYGEETVAVISFEKWGQKKIVMSYANLSIVIPPKVEEAAGEKKEDDKKKGKKAAKSEKTAKTKKTAKKASKSKTAKKKKTKKKAKKKS